MTEHATFDAFLRATFGDELEAFLNHAPAPDFIRVNPLRASVERVLTALEAYDIEVESHPADPLIFKVVRHPPNIPVGTVLQHFMGWFRVQSLGSMVPPLVLGPRPGEKVLDLCSAPGSKTTQMGAQMEGRGELWVNELSGRRMNQLSAGIDSAGLFNAIATRSDGARLASIVDDEFDRVLADVPCTGLGTRDNLGANRARFEATGRSSRMANIQYPLSVGATRLVRLGGRIVYSTCSLTLEENEEVLTRVLERYPLRVLPMDNIPGLHMRPGYTAHDTRQFHPDMALARRIVPWENPSDGFFVALLERTDELPSRHRRPEAGVAPRVPTVAWDHEDVHHGVLIAMETYGIPQHRFEAARYRRHKDKVYRLSADIESYWVDAFRTGISMLRRRGRHWRLTHTAVQHFADDISRNVAWIDDDAFRVLVSTSACPLPGDAHLTTPYPVIAHAAFGPFAIGAVDDGQLLWQVPRRYELPGA